MIGKTAHFVQDDLDQATKAVSYRIESPVTPVSVMHIGITQNPSTNNTFIEILFSNFELTLSQTTNFRPFQTQRLCRWQFKIWWKWQKVLQKGRKHCGKRRNCSLQAISPFSPLFSKDLYCRYVKTRACLGIWYANCELFKFSRK